MGKEKLYKVLGEDGSVVHGGRGQWPLPVNGKPGKWLKVSGALVPCHNGLHLCRRKDLISWLWSDIYEAEVDGPILYDEEHHKIVVGKARLLRRIKSWTPRVARLFAADCAERALRRERRAGYNPPKVSWRAIEAARKYARGKADLEDLRYASDAARSAANSAVDAAIAARSAARYAAISAAWSARDAAANAAMNSAWIAARRAAHSARFSTYPESVKERQWQTELLFRYLEE